MNFFQYTLSTLFCFFSFGLSAQENGVGIGTTAPNPSAILHVHSDNQGVLLPRLNDSQESAIITSPSPPTIPNGLLYFNTTDNVFKYRRNNGYSSLLFRGEDGRIELDLLGAAGETAKSVIDFGANGDTPPDQLDGWKIRLWGSGPLTNGDDYGFGIDDGTLWYATSGSGTTHHRWYRGSTVTMELNSNGRLESFGGYFAPGGAPGASGEDFTGYAFKNPGGAGGSDEGIYSLGDNQVSIFTNSAERVKVSGIDMTVNGRVSATESVRIAAGGPGNYLNNYRGYSFLSGGDTDGGLYSTQDGEVSIYTNGAERLEVSGADVNVKGNLRADGNVPIQVKSYTFGSSSTDNGSCSSCKNHDFLIDGNYPASEWNAVVVGYEAKQGDIDENGDGDGRYPQQVGELFTFRSGNNWFVRCNFKTEGSHESWRVEIMWIHKNMSTHHGAP